MFNVNPIGRCGQWWVVRGAQRVNGTTLCVNVSTPHLRRPRPGCRVHSNARYGAPRGRRSTRVPPSTRVGFPCARKVNHFLYWLNRSRRRKRLSTSSVSTGGGVSTSFDSYSKSRMFVQTMRGRIMVPTPLLGPPLNPVGDWRGQGRLWTTRSPGTLDGPRVRLLKASCGRSTTRSKE